MVHESLVNYIKQSLQAGSTRSQIEQTLVQTGWQQADIDDSFAAAIPPPAQEVPTVPIASAPITSTTTQQPYYHEQSNGGSKKKWFLLLIPFLLILGGGGVLAYQMITPTPERIVAEMIKKTGSIETISTKADLSLIMNLPSVTQSSSSAILVPQQPNQKVNLDISFESVSDASDLEDPKSSLKFSGQMKDSTGNPATSVETEMRTLGNVLYVRLLDFATAGQKMLPQYENKWIKMDYNKLQEKYGIEKTETNTLSEKDVEKMEEVLADSKVMKNLKMQKDDQIDGLSMYVISFDIDKDELKRVMLEALKIVVKDTEKSELDNFEKELSLFLSDITFGPQEMLIGKADKYLYRYEGAFAYSGSQSESKIEGKYSVNMKDHNKPVTIDEPKDATDFDVLLQEIYGTPEGGTLPSPVPLSSPVLGDRTSSVSAQMEQEQAAAAQLLNIFYLNDEASKILRK